METVLRMAIETNYKMPQMPNFLIPDKAKNDAVQDVAIHIKTLTREQAIFVANTMAKEFLAHWASFQTKEDKS